MTDQLKKFLLEDRTARVSAVEMESVWHAATERHQYPPAVMSLLGELMSAAALLASSLKFDGALLLQLQGNGPIRLLVVECRADLSMRATIKFGDEALNDQQHGLRELINPDGEGRFSVILNPPKDAPHMHPYQGIVSLDTDSVAQAIEQYMEQSEQLSTKLWLSVTEARISGLMLQRMPAAGGHTSSDSEHAQSSWEQAKILCNTITPEELSGLASEELLSRLFWQNPVFSLENIDIHWHCGCSRERVATMLRSLGQPEVQEIINTSGEVHVTCEFCGESYGFNEQEANKLFTEPEQDDNTSLPH